jgi:PAS domain S-box-containing protein
MPRILLVDDQPANLLALEAILEDLGQELVRAASGEQALEVLDQQDFAVILLDVRMPGLDGFETAERIRGRDRSRHTPIIFLTAHDTDQFPAAEAYRLGAVDYLVKPLVPEIVRAKVAAFVELFAEKQQARRQAEQLRLIVQGVTDYAIFMLDPDGRVATWNAGAQRLKGYTAGEIIGRHFSCFYPQEARERDDPGRGLARAAAEGRFEDEGWRVRKEGSRFWANVVLTALRDADGNLKGFAKITRDVTERKRAEQKMAAYAARLQRSNKELEQFASVASHDLQEPLRKIQTFGDRLLSKCGDALDEEGREYLQRMQNAAARMRDLIQDLLTFSRVSSKARPFVPVDLGVVVREVVSDLEGVVQQTGGRVEVGALPVLEADPLQMRQLFQNLIGNGLKFHRPDEPPVVLVSGRVVRGDDIPHSPELCEITVTDNGIGFEETYRERIFELFQRLHGRQEYEGTGMGLATCRKIVERHGGSITAHSTPGQGATFVVTLPSKQPQEDSGHDATPQADHHRDGGR